MPDIEVNIGEKVVEKLEKQEKPIEISTIPSKKDLREVDKRAEELLNKNKLPKAPGKFTSFEEMISWLDILTSEMKSLVTIYVYRWKPVVINQLADPDADNNIDKIVIDSQPLTLQYMIDTHGGGDYGFKINANKTTHFEAKLQLSMAQYPPNLDYNTVDWMEKKNLGYKTWAMGKGIIDAKGRILVGQQQGQQMNGGMGNLSGDTVLGVVRELNTFYSKMNTEQQQNFRKQAGVEGEQGGLTKSIGEILLEKMKQEDPNKSLTAMTGMMAAMKTLMPEQKQVTSSSGLSEVLPFLTMMAEQSKSNMTLMMEMMKLQMEGRGEKETTKLSEVKEMFELFSEMKGGSSSKRGTAEVIIDKVGDIIPGVLQTINTVLMLKASQGQGSNTNQPNQSQTQQTQQIQPNPVVVTRTPQNSQQLAGVPTLESIPDLTNNNNNNNNNKEKVVEMPSQPQQSQNNLTPLFTQYGGMIVNALNANVPGYEFAANLVGLMGTAVHHQIANVGVDGVLNAMKQNVEFWNAVGSTWGEAHMKKWVEEFIDYEKILDEMEKEGEIEEK